MTGGLTDGTDFVALLRSHGHDPFQSAVSNRENVTHPLTHGTTICALRYAEGVVMAGDRRATAGNVIAHRSMEKVYAADRHSGVAIAGAAGAAMEMVKIFQLQLEHYEKLEGVALSFEGKANTLAQMVRSNLPAAMQMGMVVVPLFAGYDLRRRRGRIFTYDVTGGRYEETDFQAEGSGGATPARRSSSAGATGCPATRPSSSPSWPCTRRPTRTPPPGVPIPSGGSTR